MTVGLLTDHYELTMLESALQSGAAERPCVFEVFARRLPPGRRFGVVAGTGRLLAALPNFRFDDAAISFPVSCWKEDNTTCGWMANYRFPGAIDGCRAGEPHFARS